MANTHKAKRQHARRIAGREVISRKDEDLPTIVCPTCFFAIDKPMATTTPAMRRALVDHLVSAHYSVL